MNNEQKNLLLCAHTLTENAIRNKTKVSFHDTLATVSTQYGAYKCEYTAIRNPDEPFYQIHETSIFCSNDGRILKRVHEPKSVEIDNDAILTYLKDMIGIFHDDIQSDWLKTSPKM